MVTIVMKVAEYKEIREGLANFTLNDISNLSIAIPTRPIHFVCLTNFRSGYRQR